VKSRVRSLLRVVVVLALVVTSRAGAFHDEPRRAKTIKAPLVTSYVPCTSPNTVTLGFPALSACHPAQRMDTLCGFANVDTSLSGYGKASGKARPNGDFKIEIVAKGLSLGCEGHTLCGNVRVRATTHRCDEGPCTVVDMDFNVPSPTSCCTVVSGACVVSTTINSEVLGTLVAGDRTGFEVFGFGLKRTTGPDLPTGNTFASGGLTP
jgi:hypothetical protein